MIESYVIILFLCDISIEGATVSILGYFRDRSGSNDWHRTGFTGGMHQSSGAVVTLKIKF